MKTAILVVAVLISLPVAANAAGSEGSGASLGCLHQTIKTCTASIARYMTVDNDPETQSPPKKIQLPGPDGRMIDGMSYAFFGTPKSGKGTMTVAFFVEPGDKVLRTIATVPVRPSAVGQTEDDYVRGGVYEIADLLLGDKCVGNRTSFYQFMNSQVKPKLVKPPEKSLSDPRDGSSLRYAPNIPICNGSMSFTQTHEFDAANIGPGNPNGLSIVYVIKVK